jgi:hypothetical protein
VRAVAVSLQATATVDSGLGAVVMLLCYHGIGADPGWIRPRFVGILKIPSGGSAQFSSNRKELTR